MTAENSHTGKTPKKRAAPISYRPPVALRDEFYERVVRSGLSVSAFITRSIFQRDPPRSIRRASPQERDLVRVLAQLAAITDAIKSGHADTPETHARLLEARTILMAMMGRRT